MISQEMGRLGKVLDMLRHYWFIKGIVSDKMMEQALIKIGVNKNPFLDKEFVAKMKELRDQKYDNYPLSHEVFQIKLREELKYRNREELMKAIRDFRLYNTLSSGEKAMFDAIKNAEYYLQKGFEIYSCVPEITKFVDSFLR